MLSRRKMRQEQGQTMVEFALVMPVLLLVIFGIIQFGVLYNDYISLTDATRVGARRPRSAVRRATRLGSRRRQSATPPATSTPRS